LAPYHLVEDGNAESPLDSSQIAVSSQPTLHSGVPVLATDVLVKVLTLRRRTNQVVDHVLRNIVVLVFAAVSELNQQRAGFFAILDGGDV
jgi:hypothetical protein